MSLTLSKKSEQVKPSSTLAITAKAKEMKSQGIDVVGFGAGEPDFNTPQNICDAAIKAIGDGFTKYTPASGTNELKEAVCKKFKEFNGLDYAPNQIVISNGGKHSLTNVFDALLNPGDEVIIPAPYWLSYPEMVKLSDGVPVIITGSKEQNYKVSAAQIEAAVTDKTKALVLNTPSNPTGMVYTRDCGKAAYITKARVQLMRDLGSTPAPQNAFYLNLGLETLRLRMKQHCQNALAIASFLKNHDKVEWVHYADLEGDAYNDLAKKYLPNGTCGVLAFGVKGGR